MRLRLESLCIKNIPESNSTNHSHTLNSKAACLFPSLFLPLLDCQTKLLKQNEASASANVTALTIYFILLYFTLLFLSLYFLPQFPAFFSLVLTKFQSSAFPLPFSQPLSQPFQLQLGSGTPALVWLSASSSSLFKLRHLTLLFSSIREPSPPSRLNGIRSSLHFRETRSSVF